MYKFNEWFIGFFEGNGSFNINYKSNRCLLIINQKDIKVLVYIKDSFKIGSLKKYNGINRLTISSKEDMYYVINILNGNLILNKTNERLKLWISFYNKFYKLDPHNSYYITYRGPGQFNENSSWLSGFIDAEGCFNIRIVDYKKHFFKFN